MSDDETKGLLISEAIAEYIGVEPESIRGWVVACERDTPEGVSFSTVWSINVPIWGLLGYAEELKKHLENQRDSVKSSTNGVAAVAPSRAQRRGTRGRRK